MNITQITQQAQELQLNEQDEIQHILGRPPGWLLQWGITLVFIGVITFLAIGWFVRYPDIIEAPVVLTTTNPPIRVITRSAGKVEALFVQDQQNIEAGHTIAVLENGGKWEDGLKLEHYLHRLEKAGFPLGLLHPPKNLILDDLQNSYSTFVQNVQHYTQFLKQDISQQKALALQQEIVHLRSLNQFLMRQEKIFTSEVELVKKNLERNKLLFQDKSVSVLELEKAETSHLQHQRQLESLKANIINNNIRIEQLEIQILELGKNKSKEENVLFCIIKEDCKKLLSEITNWKMNYLIEAPITGKISISKIWSNNQFINAGEELLTIVPEAEATTIIGKVQLSSFGAGKIKEDMDANIRLDGYPYQEFGSLEAKIKSISLVPQEGGYVIDLSFPFDTLTTTYNKIIPFRQEMPGAARIITEDRRVLERIFDQLQNLFKNK